LLPRGSYCRGFLLAPWHRLAHPVSRSLSGTPERSAHQRYMHSSSNHIPKTLNPKTKTQTNFFSNLTLFSGRCVRRSRKPTNFPSGVKILEEKFK
jgi:hypothetical protein